MQQQFVNCILSIALYQIHYIINTLLTINKTKSFGRDPPSKIHIRRFQKWVLEGTKMIFLSLMLI